MISWKTVRPFVPRAVRANPAVRRLANALRGPQEEPSAPAPAPPADLTPAAFWTDFNVTLHHPFRSAEESLAWFEWRNAQYPGYIERMPASGKDGLVVLDYGCGPGHDLVGFGALSRPERLIGVDVSPTSLAEARARVALHGIEAELIRIDDKDGRIPLEDASVDYAASSGVLHHVADPVAVLEELRRVLKPTGELRVMVYNYHSIYLHLFTAYNVQIVEGRYRGEPVRDAFRHLSDREDCPIANIYTPAEWAAIGAAAGFSVEHLGNAVALNEMIVLPQRFAAAQRRELAKEHRDFLLGLRFDERGFPLDGLTGVHAGIDGCYSMRPTAS